MRAWPVAHSIESLMLPYVREANERTTSWINRLLEEKRKLRACQHEHHEQRAGRVSPRQKFHYLVIDSDQSPLCARPPEMPAHALQGRARAACLSTWLGEFHYGYLWFFDVVRPLFEANRFKPVGAGARGVQGYYCLPLRPIFTPVAGGSFAAAPREARLGAKQRLAKL